ncbi:MAG: hypothetical protein SPH68_08095 [Candidatus Borkfalkiaceae bacterium]|nr:hypothetical protein [Clostridia bacterium]MDY6224099.1 hypothetical protein [Christensenellaceae bacterium]
MNTKSRKLSIALLSALAAVALALAGIFAIGAKTNGKASAEDAPVITLGTGGTGRWASANENMSVKFGNVTWTGELANGGNYYGNIYSVEDGTRYASLSDPSDATPVYFTPTASGENGNFVFFLKNVVTAETKDNIKQFLIKKTEPFTRAGVSCYFDNDYVVTCNWGGGPSASVYVAPATVSLGTGVWSTSTSASGDPRYTVSMNSSADDGSFIKGYYYGNIYSTDGSVYTGAYLDFLVKEGEEETASGKIVATFTNVKGAEKITEFVLKSTDLFKKGDGRCPFYFDKNYVVTVNWDGVPAIREDLRTFVSLSGGVSSDEAEKSVTAGVSALNGVAPSGEYKGNVYPTSGEKIENVVFAIEAAEESNALKITLPDTSVTDFVVKAGESYAGTDGREIYFDKDYRITLSWGETPVIKQDNRIFLTLSEGAATTDAAEKSVTVVTSVRGAVIGEKAYEGYAVDKNGEKTGVSLYVTVGTENATVKVVLDSTDTEFFALRKADKFVDEDGNELFFNKDCTVSCVWGEEATVTVIGATEHVWSDEKTHTGADCTEKSYKYKECIIHGDTEVTEELPDNHRYGDVITEDSTCAQKGRTYKKCEVCGHEENLSVIEKKEHTPSDWITDTNPTTEAEGSAHKECTACGETLESKVLPKAEKSGCSGNAFVNAMIPLTVSAAALFVLKKRKNKE